MAQSEAASDDATDMLIRSVMVDERRSVRRTALPELEPSEPGQTAKTAMAATPTVPAEPTVPANPAGPPRARRRRADNPVSTAVSGLKARILGYRPTRKHVAWAALALVMVLKPWLIPGILFVAFWVGLIVWLTLGPDRVGEIARAGWDRLSTRRPALADRLRQRGDAFALRYDTLLKKLPARWAERLALPDLSTPTDGGPSLEDRPDPFERLAQPEVYRG